MSTLARAHYRIPTATAHAQVSLDEFSREQIEGYLAHLDGKVREAKRVDRNLVIDEEEISHIATLVLCGQKQAARDLVAQIVGEHIGRSLA